LAVFNLVNYIFVSFHTERYKCGGEAGIETNPMIRKTLLLYGIYHPFLTNASVPKGLMTL